MGKVRPRLVKRTAARALKNYPERFQDGFDSNKKAMSELFTMPSKRMRNRIAGYASRLAKILARESQ